MYFQHLHIVPVTHLGSQWEPMWWWWKLGSWVGKCDCELGTRLERWECCWWVKKWGSREKFYVPCHPTLDVCTTNLSFPLTQCAPIVYFICVHFLFSSFQREARGSVTLKIVPSYRNPPAQCEVKRVEESVYEILNSQSDIFWDSPPQFQICFLEYVKDDFVSD